MAGFQFSLCFISFSLILFSSVVMPTTFTMLNHCNYTVWPATLAGAGTPQLSTTGFSLQTGESTSISVPSSWSGRVWGRTLCVTNSTTGKFSCATGDCGSGSIQCAGGAAPPVTLAEFTLDGAGGLDFYDVSLVDGYNVPMLVVPQGGSGRGNCSATGCPVDLSDTCPSDLRVMGGAYGTVSVACKSACLAFGTPQYCCTGAFATPDACKPSNYSEYFKNACPSAYSYAYDDGTSTFTCASANYVITFCPIPTTSAKLPQKPEVTKFSYSSTGCNSRWTQASLIAATAASFATIFAVANNRCGGCPDGSLLFRVN
ncbi:hypothetical protein NMG60_11026309 [Bertholletia excelsa]